MQPRRVARELAFLGLSQLPANPAKLDQKQLDDLLLAAVRTLTEEAKDVLITAAEEVQRSDRLLQESIQELPDPQASAQPNHKVNKGHDPAAATETETAVTRIQRLQDQLRRTELAIRTSEPSRAWQSELMGLTQQAKTSLANATQYLTQLEQRLQSVREMMQDSIKLSQTAINRVGYALSMPELLQVVQSKQVRSYALELISTVQAHKSDIDATLKSALVGWQLNRIGRIERDVLRIAIVEIKILSGVPDRVAINEAVELAKKYGDEDSHSFINGVLRRVMNARPTADQSSVT